MVPQGDGLSRRRLPASALIVLSTLLFSTMGVCVKLASADYPPGEIVFYRGLTGAVMMAALILGQGGTLATRFPALHVRRSLSGVMALCLWFFAIGNLPLATAMTLNYMSPIWMALFLVGGAAMFGKDRVDGRLVVATLIGFVGVALVLRPTIEARQLWHGLAGLVSGMLSATAYLQVSALGRVGESESRVVFYFSIGSLLVGALSMVWTGVHALPPKGVALMLGVGVSATFAQWLLTRAYSIGRPLVNASLQYLGIAFSFGYGVWLFDDKVNGLAVVGMGLIVCSSLLANVLRIGRAPSAPARSNEADEGVPT